MTDLWKSVVIGTEKSLLDAINVLNKTGLEIVLVCDENYRFSGTVTDGDIRKGLVRGIVLTDPISTVVNENASAVTMETDKRTITNLFKNFFFKYFINQKGGFLENADKSQIYILHPNGETVLVGKKNIFAQNAKKYEIHPGSIIFVPRKLNERFIFTQNAQAYAAILGNLGVSLASISVLKD